MEWRVSMPDRSAARLRVPLVVRHVPSARTALAHKALPALLPKPGQTWWELIDPASGDAESPSAVAVTMTTEGGCVVLLDVAASHPSLIPQVVGQLLAALRATMAERVVAQVGYDVPLKQALLDVGFLLRCDGG